MTTDETDQHLALFIASLEEHFPSLRDPAVLLRLSSAWQALQTPEETTATCNENIDVCKALLTLAVSTAELRAQVDSVMMPTVAE